MPGTENGQELVFGWWKKGRRTGCQKIKVGPEREGRKAHTSRVFPRTKERQTFVPDERQEWGKVGSQGRHH